MAFISIVTPVQAWCGLARFSGLNPGHSVKKPTESSVNKVYKGVSDSLITISIDLFEDSEIFSGGVCGSFRLFNSVAFFHFACRCGKAPGSITQ